MTKYLHRRLAEGETLDSEWIYPKAEKAHLKDRRILCTTKHLAYASPPIDDACGLGNIVLAISNWDYYPVMRVYE